MQRDMIEAVKAGNRRWVETLLAEDPGLVNAHSAEGASAVLLACYYGHPMIAALLVERGAELDPYEAAAAGSLEAVRRYVQADPSRVNQYAPDGFQLLGLAAFFGHPEIVAYLLDQGAEVSSSSHNPLNVMPIHSAAANRRAEIVRMLLEHGADPNARQGEDFTPLHSAAQNGDVELTGLLLHYGADPGLRSTSGQSPADLARSGGYTQVVELLEI